jgi:hypothetical protein
METSFPDSARSHSGGLVPSRRWERDFSAARLAPADLMGRGDAAVLPRLDGTAVEYLIAAEDRRAILLAQTLTALGIAEPGDWEQSKQSPSGYIRATLNRWIANHGGAVVRRQFAVCASIASSPHPYADEDTRSNLLYLIVNPDSAGYAVIGPTLELLAAVHPRLPVSFYRLFVGSVRRWARVYDFDDALDRVEMLRDWLEGEPNPEEYELPDVEGCLPKYMQAQPLEFDTLRIFAQKTNDHRIARILTAVLNLNRVSKKVQRAEISDETREMYMDSNPPLPVLLVTLNRHDAVAGCFDEDSQGMLEAEPEPNLIVELNPGERPSVQQAFEALATLCETMAAASRLMCLLPGNEEA